MVKLGTSEPVIFEHTEKDNYWGNRGEASGKNRLVQILMQVREDRGQFKPA